MRSKNHPNNEHLTADLTNNNTKGQCEISHNIKYLRSKRLQHEDHKHSVNLLLWKTHSRDSQYMRPPHTMYFRQKAVKKTQKGKMGSTGSETTSHTHARTHTQQTISVMSLCCYSKRSETIRFDLSCWLISALKPNVSILRWRFLVHVRGQRSKQI